MKLLRLSLCAVSALALLSGCSSSSTSGSSNPSTASSGKVQKLPDDEARELIVELGTLTEKDRAAKGKAIAMKLFAIKSQLSEPLRKDVEFLLESVVVRETSGNDAASQPRPTSVVTEELTIPDVRLDRGLEATVKEAAGGIKSKPNALAPEVAPDPREIK